MAQKIFFPIFNICISYFLSFSEVYCKGPILEAVNYHKIYNDSKDFVDSVLLAEPAEINAEFKKIFGPNPIIPKIDRTKLNNFIIKFFNPPESELDVCEPEDWVEKPEKIIGIQDDSLREWALNLHGIWKTLCRKVKQNLFSEKDKHSLLFVKNPFIIPGGRFREFYYWDTYWIIKGLLVSGMDKTSKYMLENLLDMVNE
uniref:Trehalase n=1 Tax=Bursaphelenchus xylophilus TaxID=6326 RepID=A0A1I7SJ38_BURXY